MYDFKNQTEKQHFRIDVTNTELCVVSLKFGFQGPVIFRLFN